MRKIQFTLTLLSVLIAEFAIAQPVYRFVSPTLELINYSASEILHKTRYTAEVEIEGKGPAVNLTSQTRYMAQSELTSINQEMNDNPEFDSKSGVWIYLANTPENLAKILTVFLQMNNPTDERRLALSIRDVPVDTSLLLTGTVAGCPTARVKLNSPFPYIRFGKKAQVDIVQANHVDDNPEQTYEQSKRSAALANQTSCDALLLANSIMNFLSGDKPTQDKNN